MIGQDLVRGELVGGDVEEAFDRFGVQVEQQQAVGARQRDEVRDQLGCDRFARPRLALLARVAVVGDDRRHPAGRRAPQRVQEDEELHQVLVDGMAGGLHHEHVVAAHRVLDLDVDLAVREPAHARIGERHRQLPRDQLRQLAVGAPTDQLERTPG